MNLLFITTGLGTGGAEMMLYQLLLRLNRERFTPTIISLMDRGTLSDRIEALGIPVYTIGMQARLPTPGTIVKLLRLVHQLKPDLIQGWMYHANLAAQLARIVCPADTPVLWDIQCSLYSLKFEKTTTALVIQLCAFLSKLPEKIIYVSRVSQTQHETLGYCKSKSYFIPNACDPSRFTSSAEARAAIRTELELPKESFLIGLICRYHPMKDHANFLQAAAQLSHSHPEIQFVLAGQGVDPQNETLHKLIQELGVSSQTHLLGERHDIPRLMAALDIACSASAYGEGCPLVVAEAMSCEVPCVVTDVGDSGWVVGKTGIVVPPKDSEALATAWETLVKLDVVDRQALGKTARRRIMDSFSLDSVASQYEALYERALVQKQQRNKARLSEAVQQGN